MAPSILYVKTSSLGDILHGMPAISDLRRAMGPVAIDWMIEEAYAPLAALQRDIRRVIPIAQRRWRRHPLAARTWHEIGAVRAALGPAGYDHIIDAQGLVKSALASRLARGLHCGFDRASAREPLAALFYERRYAVPRNLHAIERCRMLAGLIGGYTPEGPPDYGLARPPGPAAGGPPTAVLLHASARPEKLWPEAEWQALGRRLGEAGFAIALPHGNDAEEARARRLAAALPGAEVPARAGLDALAALIGRARLVVGVDTGLLHLAAALAVPLVGIYLRTDPAATGPVGAGPIAVCGGPARTVSADEVWAAIGRLQPALKR